MKRGLTMDLKPRETSKDETAAYEQPLLADYGTLLELTAGASGAGPDFCSKSDEGGSYSSALIK